jgi:hypothetical protein
LRHELRFPDLVQRPLPPSPRCRRNLHDRRLSFAAIDAVRPGSSLYFDGVVLVRVSRILLYFFGSVRVWQYVALTVSLFVDEGGLVPFDAHRPGVGHGLLVAGGVPLHVQNSDCNYLDRARVECRSYRHTEYSTYSKTSVRHTGASGRGSRGDTAKYSFRLQT